MLARLAVYLFLSCPLFAELQVAGIFTDGLVLQRQHPAPIWGRAVPGARVTVAFAGTEVTTPTDASGRWEAVLGPMEAESTGRDLVVSGDGSKRVVRNVVVGEVWHASGQSNMGMNLGSAARRLPEVRQHIAAADLPAIRFRQLDAGPSRTPLDAVPPGAWTPCTPANAPRFSAAAFYFARRLHEELGVPVGILDSSRGGTPIEPFIPREAFRVHPTLERELALGDADDLAGITALAGGVRARSEVWLPGRLYHSRLAPVARFAVRGVAWYQGESNCGVGEDPRDYRHKMRALVTGWRAAFESDDLPFYYVQLPGSGARRDWPFLREEQRLCADLPGVGMAVTIDLVDPDIHPPNKFDVGERLARWALAKTYARDIAYSGPLYESAAFSGDTATVHFSFADGGLMTANKEGLAAPRETPGTPPAHFEVTGADNHWHPAEAVIEGKTVSARSAKVPEPVAVRYGFAPSPAGCNLYNRNALPASPFCSDPSRLSVDPALPPR